ncbi:S-layer homology domain-containing protein [Colidextribacter sp. OB.20]|uniref:S-layer homology domain-containing protein n=1 Tax=Colidextribacter sp. OB.20 TaxID=2304568 RepID=UPI00136E7FC7|nr:S-layer homology domain-containing protein [Colidextribacter sp. OB.20]NBI10100.1 S-layer homology domain-containing protein [Colidextribacter sp. OB.20]
MKIKRFFSALLSLCLTLALALPISAAGSAVPLAEATQALTALGILDSDSGTGRPITRAEFVTMAVKAMPGGSGVGQAASSPYPDVPRSHWASGYVEAAVSYGLVTAFSDGTFRPDREVKLAEGASMVLALLGYQASDFSGAYPTGQLSMFRNLRLNRGLSAVNAGDTLSWQDGVFLFYNLLSARTKEGTAYIQTLGFSLDASGKPDLVNLVNQSMEGPVVAQSGWSANLGFTPGRVYRNGALSTMAAVQDYDVLYWNASMGAVWAYSKKVTGTIQAVAPSGASPSSVTVAGRTYNIESSSAAYALSDLGQYGLGSNVTLLLGRGGGVAAVADVSASAGERMGVVLEVSNGSYPDGKGGSYAAQTVTLLATDGQTYQYQARGTSLKAGSLVRAAVDGSGEITVRRLSSGSLSGKVDKEGARLDSYAFAGDVEILDVSGSRGAVISPERLAGLSLDKGEVRYYALNGQKEIETLILSDVTGDAGQYGILSRIDSAGEGMYEVFSYEFDLDGQTYVLPGTTTHYPVSAGPVQVVGDPANPERLRSLTSAGTGEVSGNQFIAGSRRYTLSDSVAVYEYRDGRYYLSSLARAESASGKLSAWYDKAESEGGRIRVLIIR